MDLQPRGYDKVVRLLEKGVTIPNPLSLDIGDEVDCDRISGEGVVIMPGCRIYGAGTVISSHCRLGAEGPVTLDECRLGPGVELKGGYFRKSVFLQSANMGSGAQVREGCLLEEEANGAHCVGLKQTILFPFVTLGSLINLCDCLMSGGTSRKDHSEVGSSYIHFNYTPDGDKTTASLFGDVPRGVMLDQQPIFLGGQGGAVGPLRLGYGTVVAAGCVIRHDVTEDGNLVVVDPIPGFERRRTAHAYRNLVRIVRNNVLYLANLTALECWYRNVRQPFFLRQQLGELVYEGALDVLKMARTERIKRLQAMAAKVPPSAPHGEVFATSVNALCAVFGEIPEPDEDGLRFLEGLRAKESREDYLTTIQGLDPELRLAGTAWLERITAGMVARANETVTPMDLSDTRS